MSDGTRLFSSSEVLRYGWTQTKQNLQPLLMIGVVGAFCALVNQALAEGGGGSRPHSILMLLCQIVQVAVAMVFTRAALKIHDEQPLEPVRISDYLQGFFGYLLTSILYGLIVGVGLLLLVVPGVVWGLKYAFAGFL